MLPYPAEVCPVCTTLELCQGGSSSPPPAPPSVGYLSQSEGGGAERGEREIKFLQSVFIYMQYSNTSEQ